MIVRPATIPVRMQIAYVCTVSGPSCQLAHDSGGLGIDPTIGGTGTFFPTRGGRSAPEHRNPA